MTGAVCRRAWRGRISFLASYVLRVLRGSPDSAPGSHLRMRINGRTLLLILRCEPEGRASKDRQNKAPPLNSRPSPGPDPGRRAVIWYGGKRPNREAGPGLASPSGTSDNGQAYRGAKKRAGPALAVTGSVMHTRSGRRRYAHWERRSAECFGSALRRSNAYMCPPSTCRKRGPAIAAMQICGVAAGPYHLR